MQVAKSVVLSIVDDYGVHVWHVDATLDYGCREQHVIIVISKVDNALL